MLQLSGGLLWALIVFTSLLGLNRSFNHEKEQGCMEGILLVPMDRSVIFLAKATSNLLFLLVVEVIAVPLFWFFFLTTAQPGPGFMLMAVPLAVGTIGMAGIGTLLSTITVNTRGKDVMLAVLFVPLIFPLLYACASATTAVVVAPRGISTCSRSRWRLPAATTSSCCWSAGFCTISLSPHSFQPAIFIRKGNQ